MRCSKPKLDIAALKRTADSYGGRMTLLHNSNTYTVVGVDIVHDTNGPRYITTKCCWGDSMSVDIKINKGAHQRTNYGRD